MNPKDIKRLMELTSKGIANLNEAEKAEYTTLSAKMAALDQDASLEDVSATVEAACAKVLTANAGKAVTPEQLKTALTEALAGHKGVDEVSLAAKIDAAVKGIKPGVSADDLKAALVEFAKSLPGPSKMVHTEDEGAKQLIDFPITHRSGNLSVSQKQLLNALLKGKQFQNIEIPEHVINEGIPEQNLKTATANGERAVKMLQGRLLSTKAITAGGAGTGQEFMNVTISAVLLQRLYLESQFAAAMLAREIQMPSNPYKMPLATTRPVFQSGVAENAAPTGSQPGSAQPTLDAKKLMGMVQWSDESDEDSIIPVLPMVTDQLGQAGADAFEDALINGDTTGAQDALGAAGDALRLFDGIRKLSLAQAALKLSLATGGISAANIGALRKLMGKWGMKPADLLILCGTNAYNDLVLLPETLTAEKAGNQATARILTGQAPNIFGIDIVPSARVREDLNATGVFDNTTTTKGSIHVLHKPSWLIGSRRGFTLETFRDPRAGTNYLVASFRRAFVPMESLANIKGVVTGFNYTS